MLASVSVRSRSHKGSARVIPSTTQHMHHPMWTARFLSRSAMLQNKVLVENVVLHPSNSFHLFPAHVFNGPSKMHPGNKREGWQYWPLLYFLFSRVEGVALRQTGTVLGRKALHSRMSWAWIQKICFCLLAFYWLLLMHCKYWSI